MSGIESGCCAEREEYYQQTELYDEYVKHLRDSNEDLLLEATRNIDTALSALDGLKKYFHLSEGAIDRFNNVACLLRQSIAIIEAKAEER